ncbi:MAG: hypothetical protein K1X88_07475 [Nannocystaceae bacterium]|nr:hypothetical protein [Nannocystaceae bacterium]
MRTHALSLVVLGSLLAGCPSGDDGGGGGSGSSGGSGSESGTTATTMTSGNTMTSTTASTTDTTTASTTMTTSDTDTATTTDATSSTGADSSSSASGGSSSDTGAGGYSVSGSVTRSAAAVISLGDDGIGTLYVGVLMDCDQNAASVGGTSVAMADLSQLNSPVPYTVEGLPNGTYYVAGFLDDDENADPDAPDADMGDLAFAMGFGIGCVEVVIEDADVTGADFALNVNVPF